MAPRTQTNGHADMTADAADAADITLINGTEPVLEEYPMIDPSQTSDPTFETPADTPADEPTATTPDAAPTPEAPVYGDPFTLPETGWETNTLVLVGEVTPPRERSGKGGKKKVYGGPRITANDGNVYQLTTVTVHAPTQHDQSYEMRTRLDVLIPIDHPMLEQLNREGGIVSIHGRIHEMVSRNRREETLRVVIDNGVYVQRQEAIVAHAIERVAPETPQYVIGHLSGEIEKVVRLDTPLDPRIPESQYHIVRLKIQEAFPRRAPGARGKNYVTTTVTLYVPTIAEEANVLLRQGNRVSVEIATIRAISWRADRSLETVKPELRDRSRMQVRDEFLVTFIDGTTATPLTEEEYQVLTSTVSERQRNRKRRLQMEGQRRREEAQRVLANQDTEQESVEVPSTPVAARKPRQKPARGAAQIPSIVETGGV